MFLETTTSNIRRRVAVVGTILIVAPMLVLSVAVWAVTQRIQQPAPINSVRPSNANLLELTQNLVDICRKYRQDSVDKLNSGQIILDAAGPVRLDGSQLEMWQARNEVTNELKPVQLPLMSAGETKFVPVMSFDQIAPVVDEIARVDGTPATIFERMDEQGDMLRICSSLKSESGGRAIGSYVPAEARDGDAAKALHQVLEGKTYIGKELQADVTYLTAYQPLKNTLGNVVGMLYTALPEDQIETQVRHLVVASTTINHPELFIFEATGERRGTALVMGNRSLEGSNLWNEKDPAGRLYVQELCSRALLLSAGEFGDAKYQQTARVGGIPRAMTARFAYLPELEWVVGFAEPDGSVVAGTPPMLGLATLATWFLWGVGLAGTGLAVRIWLEFSDDLAQKLNMLLGHLKNDARQLSQTAAEISEVVAKTGVDAEAETMIEEIHLALQHLDASGESVAAMIEAIDQIAFAANLLLANAAIQSSSSPDAADDLRSLADRCGKAARTTKAEIEQSRAELEKGNHEVAQSSTLLLRQSETLLQLAEGIDQTVEVIAANLGVGPSETAPGSFN